MKKISRNIFFFVIVFIFFLGLAPRLFFVEEFHDILTKHISESLASTVTIKKMHWVWLPLPHLTLISTSLTDGHYDFFLPKVKIYPTWRIILGETHKPKKIVLDSPQFHINKRAFLPRESPERNLPELTLTINNGAVEIEATEYYKDILRKGSVKFSNINGTVKLLPQVAAVDLKGSSPVSKKMSLQGSLNIPDRHYRFSLDAQDIKLHRSIKAFFDGRLIPVESPARLTGTVTGKGIQEIEGNLHGTLPCFVVKPEDREILLTCGFADLKLVKSGPLLRLDINDLEIKDPQVNLSGHIERKLSSISSEEQSQTPEPEWTLDITGSDLDLTAIRQKILTLWGGNKVAKTVSSIVHSGRALSASYRFSGTAADFKRLDAMIIEADILNADIHVPGAKLDLTNASGSIRIKDSLLTGQSLSAQFGKSYGHNADLLLDLGRLGRIFKLSIDIDADLEALPPILARSVKHDGFQGELMKLKEISGKASGTLYLGDSLAHLATRVEVKKMQATAKYAPVPESIFIDSGTLQVNPGVVSWQKIKGRIGGQKITGTNGSISWPQDETMLHIEEIQAELDGASLLALFKQSKAVAQKINNVISSMNGAMEITRGSLQGPVLKPESWQYDLKVKTSDMTLTTPLLPEPVSTENFVAEINQNEATLHGAALNFLDQTFSLNGTLQHRFLEGWHGMIEYNGPVQAKLASWISSKGWFPEKLQPRIPCTMEDMRVIWQGETVAVSGIILHGLDGGRLPMAKLDYENTPEHLYVNELSFYAPGEQGSLALDFWRQSPHSIVLSWKGFVNADTIDALFHYSSFTAGSFSGDFSISYLADQPEATRFEGILKAENLLFKANNNIEPIVIKNIEMKGVGRQLRFPALELTIGPEKINGSGQLAAEDDGLQLDISLASSFLSKKSLTSLTKAVLETQHVFTQDDSALKPGLKIARGWDITGRIGFDFDSFALHRKAATPYDPQKPFTYTFYNVIGDLQLAPDRIIRTEIFSAKLCGLDFRGTWFSDDDLGQKIQLDTDPDKIFRLENVLPCLGVQQDIIEGEFSLQANLLKESNTWYGGNIYIKSTQGRILRLQTLSRIFKVVNITDLFEQQVENTGKRGFPYSQMTIDTHILDNNLIIDRAIIHGEGLNLFARGEIHLDDYDADLTLLIAPFKTFDTIVSKVPIIGQPIMGEYGSRVSIPVAVKGPLAHPAITPLHPEAIGDAIFNLVRDTFMLPYNILKPLEKTEDDSNSDDSAGK
ncbi:MAG: hypothetical protein AMK70_09615 [Nitrospira bacterium SG8_35_1]|nr:MAG: hypothetical protein AMK70_09615 [Nitrospira bacterium SG8_35_1]